MKLLPADEALVPLALACALALGLPPLLRALLARVLGDGDALTSGLRGAAFGLFVCLLLAGRHAIGPSWASSPMTSWTFAVALAVLGVVLLCRRLLDLRRPWAAQPMLVGLLVGLVPLAGWVAAERATATGDRRLMEVDEGRAWWRLRVDPWDPSALLAVAWAAQRRDERSELAALRAARAEALGARTSEVRTLQATLAAARGRCEEARRLFDEALSARAREALERNEPLDLSYPLPETLVRHCELTRPEE